LQGTEFEIPATIFSEKEIEAILENAGSALLGESNNNESQQQEGIRCPNCGHLIAT